MPHSPFDVLIISVININHNFLDYNIKHKKSQYMCKKAGITILLLFMKVQLKMILNRMICKNAPLTKYSKNTPFFIQIGKWIIKNITALTKIGSQFWSSFRAELSNQPLNTISSEIPTEKAINISIALNDPLNEICPF